MRMDRPSAGRTVGPWAAEVGIAFADITKGLPGGRVLASEAGSS